MKVVILAGGMGTRLSEETHLKPKPMVDIGGKPILWHIMKFFSYYGFNEFVICLGYKGYLIKEYFANYSLHMSDLKVDLRANRTYFINNVLDPWQIDLIDTGDDTMTGGRLRRIRKYLDPSEPFFFTYGDGLCDINLLELARFHQQHGKLATVTAVRPPGRYGSLRIEGSAVNGFVEKLPGDGSFINGGFFVLSPKVLDFIHDDSIAWENQPMENLVKNGELQAFKHEGFWQAMDTIRDRLILEELWQSKLARWKIW
jgi:glucose-1-phosphate cytidylyltransferase